MTVTLLALQLEREVNAAYSKADSGRDCNSDKQKKELPDERPKSLVVRLENC